VQADLPRLTDQLAIVAPNAKLDLSQSGDVLVVSGLLGSAEDALVLRRYLDTLQTPYVDATRLPGAAQVQVNVRVAEVSRTALRALGVNGFVTGSDAFIGSTIGSSSGGAINPINIGPPESSPANGDTSFVFNDAVDVSPLITLFGGSTDGDFEVFLQALEEEQYLHILAQPNLVALSGEEASFLAGGEFPIPVVQGGAGGTGTSITIEYKAFGIALAFRPVVLGNGLVRLSVTSEVSDISDIGAIEIEGFRVPSIVTRRADTTVEMRSGQTFAMAGLISEAVSSQVTRTPWLGEIPILGSLFRSVRYRKGESELVVLVSIDLVEPLSSDALPPLPGSAHVPPTELELYGQGMIEGPTPAHTALDQELWRGKLGLGRLHGPNAWASYELPPGEARGEPANDD
jgi:pilus assembly protein CpaC